jgi:alpha-beta hydrolase superfamily lysophospholipase
MLNTKDKLLELIEQNPFNYDLGIKVITCKVSSPTDYNISEITDHNKSAYGTPQEILPLLYLLKRCACDLKLKSINLYGFSAGGGAIINVLSALNTTKYDIYLKPLGISTKDKKEIIDALQNGSIILDCPLKSIREIISFRGASKNLSILEKHYSANEMEPIDTLNALIGLDLTIFLNFENPDEILSNRDDQLFIDKLKKANQGRTIISISNDQGHIGYHTALWDNYKSHKASSIQSEFVKENKNNSFSFNEIESIQNFDLKQPQFLNSSDNIKLAYYNFSNNDKEIIIFYTGAGLYGNKTYQWVAKTLNEKYGIGCYIFDIRGHGYSQGTRGDASSIPRVLQDVQEEVEFVKKKHPNAKIYLCGHSSGAGLIINYAANTQNKLEDGYIFLAPYLGPKSDTAKTNSNSFVKNVRAWVYILGSMSTYFSHFKAIEFNYPEYILKSDPLILSYYTYVMSCATTPYDINSLLKKIDKPVGIFIGENDEQFLPEKVVSYKKLIDVPVETVIVENAAHLSILTKSPKLIFDYIKKII